MADFCRKIYLASPFFNPIEKNAQHYIKKVLADDLGCDVYDPASNAQPTATNYNSEWKKIFDRNVQELTGSDLVVAILDPRKPDAGTVWELGYASALGIQQIILLSWTGARDDNLKLNLMLHPNAIVLDYDDMARDDQDFEALIRVMCKTIRHVI